MKHDNPLGSHLLALAHYQTLLKTIVQAPIRVFPSLITDIHIMGPMNKFFFTFDHLLTQLALIEFKVKVSKCKFWSPNIFSSIEIPQYYILVTNALHILGVPMGSQNFVMHFLDDVFFHDVTHIDDFSLL
jgi:hypothetical protein